MTDRIRTQSQKVGDTVLADTEVIEKAAEQTEQLASELERMLRVAQAIRHESESVASMTVEQSCITQEVAARVGEIAGNTDADAERAKRVAQSVERLRGTASGLEQLVVRFKR